MYVVQQAAEVFADVRIHSLGGQNDHASILLHMYLVRKLSGQCYILFLLLQLLVENAIPLWPSTLVQGLEVFSTVVFCIQSFICPLTTAIGQTGSVECNCRSCCGLLLRNGDGWVNEADVVLEMCTFS
ncbi:hypothetical protein DPSP01_003478 [Paraphaeosphaeria sporulosa]